MNPRRRDFLKHAGAAAGLGAGALLGGFAAAADAVGPAEDKPVPADAILTPDEIAYLKRWDAPTIANAVESRKLRSRMEGFLEPHVRQIFPEFGPMVGYAVTATIKASEPRKEGEKYVDRFEYYEYIDSVPKPRVMVIHDQDAPNPVGSFWGEVNGNLHQALGCVGVVTDGGVRDLAPVRALKFQYFAASVIVSHAYVHLVDFGQPVKVGGHTVKSGDLLFGDEHGVVDIPHSVAKETGNLCYEIYQRERPSIDFYKSPDFSVEKLREFFESR